MPDNAVRKIETTLSDRDVLLHILAHVEASGELEADDRALLQDIRAKVSELVAVLDEFRPLLAMVKGPDGKVDMIGAAQLRRRIKRG